MTPMPYVDAQMVKLPDHYRYGDTTQAAQDTRSPEAHLVQVREGHGLAPREEPQGAGSMRSGDQEAEQPGDLAPPPAFVFSPDGRAFPHPHDPQCVEMALRYGTPTPTQLRLAAAFVGAYKDIAAAPPARQREMLDALRTAMREAESC